MATKKKTTKGKAKTKVPAGIPPVKKMIDLTKDKNDPKAVSFCTAVERQFLRSVKKLNIPVCDMMASNPHLLSEYMFSRSRYVGFLDDTIVLVDQCLRDAIAENILESLVKPELRGVVYPGKWDDFNLFALARSRVNIVMLSDKPEMGAYLTSHPVMPGESFTAEMVAETGNAITFLRMVEFNVNRLYQFAIVTGQALTQTVVTSVEKDLPTANLVEEGDKLPVRYGRELCQMIKPAVDKWAAETLHKSGLSFKTQMAKLCSDLYEPVMRYCTFLLSESGINHRYIRAIMDPSVTELSIVHVYDEVEDILDTNACAQYRLTTKDKNLMRPGTTTPYNGVVQLTLNLGKLYRMTQMESPKKADLSESGNQIKEFLTQMIAHCFNMFLIGALFIPEPSGGEEPTSDAVQIEPDALEAGEASES